LKVENKSELGIDAILDELDNIRPCTWVGLKNLMYVYVKRKNNIPLLCRQCWKVLLFFDETMEFEKLINILNERSLVDLNKFRIKVGNKEYSFKTIIKTGGRVLMVIYVMGKHSEKEKIKVQRFFRELVGKEGIRARVFARHNGRYWQDMFPELFGKNVENYKPFYLKYYEFRLRADSLPLKEVVENAKEEYRKLMEKLRLF